ncbi:transglutaminase TgpA family protein [Amphritea balenae]|uniref:DUF3488 domain-containing protein n=1 Tax=Amphritea balenae TaxID=452629 RepID=A0A3P1STH2_9GAMM|nr:DUF3488 and transglutaminase-like domain-containing protein [Amphritea balenae]RRD00499.1 DUF3488 domain-containing protein [Amphritea balenae]GGK70242.1 transglutaminase [Amphritea balenae]
MKPVYQLTRSSMIWLVGSIVLVLIPFLPVLPLWLIVLAIVSLGWRLLVHIGRMNFPHWSVRLGLLLGVLIALLWELRSGATMSILVALLVASFLLKLTEMYQRRDALVVLYVAFLLCACSFLFYQNILMAFYGLLCLIVITACLNTVYRSQQNSDLWRPLRRSVVLYLQAIPVMLVLFLIFPRIDPLWQVDLDTGKAYTGLSDSMAPGDVSKLTRSAEIAFRVSFDGEVPPANLRYWRGLTMDQFDGHRWTRSESSVNAGPVIVHLSLPDTPPDTDYQYQIIMEPSGQRWRYALDRPISYPASMMMLPDFTLQSPEQLQQRIQYSVLSRTGKSRVDMSRTVKSRAGKPRAGKSGIGKSGSGSVKAQLSRSQRQRYLQLPVNGNDKARQLAQRWLVEQGNTPAFVKQMMQSFASDFSYTLQPPRLTGDRIDQFLFQTRQGFCGHFASASVFLLRSAGIPARIVGGYQGGELNPVDGSLTVRQYEAHAWLEYWFNGDWQRLDPTSVVAPSRLDQAADQLFSSQEGFLADAALMRSGILSRGWLKQIRQQYDSVNYSWHRWVLNYHQQQNGFLQRLLGEVTALKLIIFLLMPAAIMLTVVALNLLYRRRSRPDPLTRALNTLNRQLQGRNLQRRRGETVGSFCQRLSGQFPQLSTELKQLAGCYEKICYEGDESSALEKDFIAKVNYCCRQIRHQ